MRYSILFLLFCALLFSQCSSDEKHFISDENYRGIINTQFMLTTEMAINRKADLFDVFNDSLTLEESEALRFLYASMPLNDLADYDGAYFLKVVRTTLEGRDHFSWTGNIPEYVFRHFVLPYRVNNENLDSARWVLFHQLKERVMNMSLHDAALEVNHWCHERVNYQGTDIRTSSPLSTIRTGFGRCGEESTLLVAALRSVCIPARQVYVPRWAHSDDNHAWVEVWVDGDWKFLGGCEPSAQFNQGWFAEPARRAMLVHTKAFGKYYGPEEVLYEEERFSELNVISNYAINQKVHVKVEDELRQSLEGAKVEFGLYNYAEFFPLYTTYSDEEGLCSFTTGLGDLVIYASKEDAFGFVKLSVSDQDHVKVILDRKVGDEFELSMHLKPPKKLEALPNDTTGNHLCSQRLEYEDSLRIAAIKSQLDWERVQARAKKEGWLPRGPEKMFLSAAKGNFETIFKLMDYPDQDKVLRLFHTLADKDLRDATYETLLDHLDHSQVIIDDLPSPKFFDKYVLAPRIKNEMLSPYRSFFLKEFDEEFVSEFQNNPEVLVDWINENIYIDNTSHYYDLPATPIGVYNLRFTNEESRNIFFVAASRSFGVPARLKPGFLNPQVYMNAYWQDISFSNSEHASNVDVSFNCAQDLAFDPEYYIHFSLAKSTGGLFKTLEYDYGKKWKYFSESLKVFPGYYRFLSSNRLKDESVLVNLKFINIDEHHPGELKIELPQQFEGLKVEGVVNKHLKLTNTATNKSVSISDLCKKQGAVLVLYESGEPTQHLLAELPAMKTEFDKWGGNFCMIHSSDYLSNENLNAEQLPHKMKGYKMAAADFNQLVVEYKKTAATDNYPYIFVVNSKSEIVYQMEGYQIGIPEKLLRVLHQLKSM